MANDPNNMPVKHDVYAPGGANDNTPPPLNPSGSINIQKFVGLSAPSKPQAGPKK